MKQPEVFAVLAILLGIYVWFGSIFYHFVEKWNWLDSVYFTVITLSTVGYGDFSPQTDVGKLFTIPYIFIGIGLFVAVANSLLRRRGQKALEKRQVKNGKRQSS